MAQLILSSRPEDGDEVIAVLADGVHPGKKVVEDPSVWNSKPLPGFRIIHVLNAPADAFADLMKEAPSGAMRKARVDLSPSQSSDLARDRKLTINSASSVRIKANLRGVD